MECVQILLKIGLNQQQIIGYLTAFGINDVITQLKYPGATRATIEAVSYAARPIWAEAFGVVWLVTLAFSGVGLFCSIFLGDVSKYMTNHRAVHL